ncbi:hypothetical protein NXS19_001766 [Fusarium pseudograminearum]|nr:hypothetical protein NXS19_001766 [Fusarium pseudograminearum]
MRVFTALYCTKQLTYRKRQSEPHLLGVVYKRAQVSQADPAQARPCKSSPMSRIRPYVSRIAHGSMPCTVQSTYPLASIRDRAAKAGRASPAADNAIGHGCHGQSFSGHTLRLRLGERWMPDDVLT